MFFSIEQIFVEISKQSWGIALCSGFVGSVVGGIISGCITRHATIKTNEENIKNSQRNYIFKQKIELIIKILQVILKVTGNIRSIIDNQTKKNKIWYQKEYFENIKELTDLSFQLQVIAILYPDMQDISQDIQDLYFKSGSFINYFQYINDYIYKNKCKTVDLYKLPKYPKSIITRKNGTDEILFGDKENIIEILEQFKIDLDNISNILTQNLKQNIT